MATTRHQDRANVTETINVNSDGPQTALSNINVQLTTVATIVLCAIGLAWTLSNREDDIYKAISSGDQKNEKAIAELSANVKALVQGLEEVNTRTKDRFTRYDASVFAARLALKNTGLVIPNPLANEPAYYVAGKSDKLE